MDNSNFYMQNNSMYQQQVQLPKYNKAQILQGLQDGLLKCGINITKVEQIEEEPQVLRHACSPRGISGLPCTIFPVIQPTGVMQVKYWCCPACGKVFVSKYSLEY